MKSGQVIQMSLRQYRYIIDTDIGTETDTDTDVDADADVDTPVSLKHSL